ncbi:hypothetical protein NHQ30_005472 [Ciborinia camelliae]|nr:hypothetical protein NHQ30_005472 [Ciborinia camelliae]
MENLQKHEAMSNSVINSPSNDIEAKNIDDILNQSIDVRSGNNLCNKPSFLTIPPEIRNGIYRYLLHDPELGKAGHRLRRYEIYPEILSVCRQAYHEALHILYGQKFLVACVEDYTYSEGELEAFCTVCWQHITPITRYTSSFASNEQKLHLVKAFCHVRNWKVLIDTAIYHPRTDWVTGCLTEFCRAICLSPNVFPLSFHIYSSDIGFFPIREGLQPLRLLRNIGNIEFRTATPDETPDSRRRLRLGELKDIAMLKDLEAEFSTLVKGNTPVEYIHLMYDNLLAYAQAFERDLEF